MIKPFYTFSNIFCKDKNLNLRAPTQTNVFISLTKISTHRVSKNSCNLKVKTEKKNGVNSILSNMVKKKSKILNIEDKKNEMRKCKA